MRFAPGLLLGVALISCGSDETGPPGGHGNEAVAQVEITPASATIAVAASRSFAAVTLDEAGDPITGHSVSWTTTNSQVATVNQAGVVTGKAAGSSQIIATSEGVSDTATIQVTGQPANPDAMHLVFSTFLGGSLQDQVRDIAVDAQGNVYVTGGTQSANFPTTAGAYDQTQNGNYDVYVAKLNPQGQLVWSTFIGGPNYDRAYGVEVDAQGYVYVAGRAGDQFPVTGGAFQTTFQGSPDVPPYGPQDGFVCKLKPDGSALVFCSYFGTDDKKIVRDLALDAQGNIYLGSSSESGSFPAAWFSGSYQPNRAGGVDGVVAKVSTDGSQVLWATYIGGTSDEAEQPSVRVDGQGNVFALYATESDDAPTPNGFDHSLGGIRDLYLIKLSPDGKQLLFGTYLGGSGNEGVETHELALDPQGNPIIGNSTNSADFPVTGGAFQTQLAGGTDGFVARVSADGSQLLASTFVGGLLNDNLEGPAVDAQGRIYVTGSTQNGSLSFLSNGYQGSFGGTNDMIMLRLSSDLSTVEYGTYLGGGAQDLGRAAAVTSSGEYVFGGNVESADFPLLHPVDGNYGGGLDGAVARLAPGP